MKVWDEEVLGVVLVVQFEAVTFGVVWPEMCVWCKTQKLLQNVEVYELVCSCQ